jgi:hypothetical protein
VIKENDCHDEGIRCGHLAEESMQETSISPRIGIVIDVGFFGAIVIGFFIFVIVILSIALE